MRLVPLLAGLLLATALVTLAPSGGASGVDACTSLKDASCGALVCAATEDGWWVCSDPCAYQSDCCRATGNLWCPEAPPE
ncbi:MAG TPA: hypothetical protein VNX21_03500 [Candidatus Thermoplasmatota archaeon]|nr:hypothetical protein [Candidatus Thermoplasmatota archaeon]